LSPIKLNMVVLKGVNENELEPMIDFARRERVILQLIELIDIDHDFFKAHYYELNRVERELGKRAKKVITRGMQGRKQYDIDGTLVEVVRPHQPDFCLNCTKLRVTSAGMLKPCLMRNDNLIPYNGLSSIYEALSRREPYYAHG
jgi:cyclic pyranopterin phosphate synthase